jgi:Icc-related predicted phosphoesterase
MLSSQETLEFSTIKDCARRIIHISDTHNRLVDISSLPQADVLIHTGDFSSRGSESEFQDFNDWLGEIAHLYPIRIVVLGNHDIMTHGGAFSKMVSMLSNATHVPNAEFFELCGLRILSLPYLRYEGVALEEVVEQLSKHRNIDLFLTHAPSYGVLDLSHSMTRCGSMAVKRIVLAVRPSCHLFGHVHEDYGFRQDGRLRILSVNSSMCDHPVQSIVNRGHMILFHVPNNTNSPCSSDNEDNEEAKSQWIQVRLLGVLNV